MVATLAGLAVLAGPALVSAAPAVAATPADCPWMDTSKTPEQRTNLLLDASTLDQQMRWLNEVTAGDPSITTTPTQGGLGQPPGPPVTFAAQVPCVAFTADTDGPWGIAYVGGTTAFPVPVAQAASWDLAVTKAKGEAMADEAWRKQYDNLFAPGLDLVRHPWNGRNAEYLGEDPFLAGTISATWVNALEDNPNQPVSAVLKHFLGNSQELDRASSSSNMDARTMHELYGLPYEITMKESKPAGVMCGFNQFNGIYSCENPDLLTKYLRDDLGFDGYVVTDNTAQHSTATALNSGLSQELGLPLYFTPPRLHAALDAGEITATQIRQAAYRVVLAKFAHGLMDHALPATGRFDDQRTPAAHAVAREMEDKGAVLLKNDGRNLPLTVHGKTIAVIGATASNTPTNGISAESVCSSPLFGLSVAPLAVDCPNPSAPLDAIKARAAKDGNTVVFNDGSDIASAAKVAAAADVVIAFGYNRTGESFDLDTINLFDHGDELIKAVSAANPHTTVVLETGSAVLTPWADSVPSILEAWWPGEAGGDAIAALLFGDVNPSGKLPITFPKAEADLPTGTAPNAQYPGVFSDGSTTRPAGSKEIRQVNYTEGLQLGYKWYDQQNITPQFEFGRGLSYSTFNYSGLKLNTTYDPASGAPRTTVSFNVKNTSKIAGSEVPQIYLTFPTAAAEPGKRLVGFDRIDLAPGERRTVSVVVDAAAPNHPYSIWDTSSNGWKTVPGDYVVAVGSSSRDLRLTGTVGVDAPTATVPPTITGPGEIGQTLSATPGQWTQPQLRFAYQWLRDGQAIPGEDKHSYRVGAIDAGKSISVRVTATPHAGPTGTATSAPVLVRYGSTVAVKANPATGDTSTRFSVSVQVTAAASAATAEGTVSVVADGRTYPGTLLGGTAVVSIGRLPRGTNRITVQYSGSQTLQPGAADTRIKVS
ncbi:glycoside hydrolase family 3 C-terminal domain-containing protein [Motilibacter rhizosphaerae]|uniref:glycoside hydrolase family 3 C-terminal domain-containing protein n=1 Tax=Motilibacter rhizosphaerae TaxID=598652 RepID=UPI0013EEAA8F|nr:glycoside hydrolase family 3 C-terminal domain-containing protein [Motilibacter rhizosphaerae]